MKPLPKGVVQVDPSTSIPTAAAGYTLIKGAELFSLDGSSPPSTSRRSGDAAIQPQGVTQRRRAAAQPPLRRGEGRFVRIADGVVFKDNGQADRSSRANNSEGRARAGLEGVHRLPQLRQARVEPALPRPVPARLHLDARLRDARRCCLSFAVGLFLAIALDKKGLRFQRLYRSVLVIPYAMPGFLSLLVWGGLLNDDFGVVNKLFHTSSRGSSTRTGRACR